MRVLIHVLQHYDWLPIPENTKVTPEDVAAGKVKRHADGAFKIRVVRDSPTHVEAFIKEDDIVAKIVEVYQPPPQGDGSMINRREAAARIMSRAILPLWADRRHIDVDKDFEVHDDHDLPEERAKNALAFEARLAELSKIQNARTGQPLIAPADVAELVAKYAEPTTHKHHVDHMHAHFGLKKGA